MFIEPETPTKLPFAPAERNATRVAYHPETLRSAGARVVLLTGVDKHLAPLEPEP
jgi:hypothetical protein